MAWRCFAITLLIAAGGCAPLVPRRPPARDPATPPGRDAERARAHLARGLEFLRHDKLDAAEAALREAIEADLMAGPAHNNLGVVYFRQRKLYQAAWEFQYAAKLLPGKAEPRNNLGMVFEAAGKLDEAAKWYEDAHKLEPEAVQVIGNLARLYVRTQRKDEKTRQLLGEVVLRDERPDWAAWARDQLSRLPSPPPAAGARENKE
jgi:Tfp pilus assembly protein PilF